eukprot:g23372.t1
MSCLAGSSARAAAAAQTAAAQAAVAAAGPALVWAELQHLDIFDAGEAAAAWWQQHGEAPNAVLMLSFPPPPPSEVAEAALRRFGGRWVLFIGEWRGCTGSKAFFDRLEAEWRLLGTFEVPRWPMMEDPHLGRRGNEFDTPIQERYPMIQNVLVHLTGRCCVRIRRKSDRSAAEWALECGSGLMPQRSPTFNRELDHIVRIAIARSRVHIECLGGPGSSPLRPGDCHQDPVEGPQPTPAETHPCEE